MTPEELAAEIAEAPSRALGEMVQAKLTSHRGRGRIPPLLNGLREDGSNLQITGPPRYTLEHEVDAVLRMLGLAHAWSADYALVALDTRRILDPVRALAEFERCSESTLEESIASEEATDMLLAHSFDAHNGNMAQALEYRCGEDGEADFAPSVIAVDDAWLAWSEIAHAMSQWLTPRRDFIGGHRFDDDAAAADADEFWVFVTEPAGEFVHVRVWSHRYREEWIPGGLPREEITSRIERVVSASRLAAVPSVGDSPRDQAGQGQVRTTRE